MSEAAHVLLIDEGELEDVARVLVDVGAALTRVRDDADEGPPPLAYDLLVTTARAALSPSTAALSESVPLRVAVGGDGSRVLRSVLHRAGFAYLIRRPVHPEALRLFFAHLVYRGPEKRRAPRLAAGVPVRFRSGLWNRDGTLVELSRSGCRLLSTHPPRERARVRLELPDGAGGKPWTVSGRVTRRLDTAEKGQGGGATVALAFDVSDRAQRQRIERWVEQLASGPAAWNGAAVDGLVGPEDETREQRRAPRRVYEKRVIALGTRAARVLLARDLSSGGLRVEAAPGLTPGAHVRIALHGSAVPQPLVLDAHVARRGGGGDVVLRFDELSPEARERLAKLLSDQPEIEALGAARPAARRRIVTRLVGDP